MSNFIFLYSFGTVVLGQLLALFSTLNFQPLLTILTVLTLVFGGVILFQNPEEFIQKLEKIQVKESHQKSKYINGYVIILILIVIAGILFRLVHINQIGIYFDEYRGLSNALGTQDHGVANFFLDGKWSQNEPRFRYTTWFVGWLISIFGKSLLVARLPGIIMSSLTAIPLYFLMSRINRLAGLTAAVIWLMSPWAIVIGRFFREYAYFPFYYVLIFIILLKFAEYLIAIIRMQKSRNNVKLISGTLAVIFPLIYAFVLGRNTTFKLVVVPYAIGILYFFHLFWMSRKKDQPLLSKRGKFLVAVFFVLSALSLVGIFTRQTLNILPHYDPSWIILALENGPRNWFSNTGPLSFFLMTGLGILGSLALAIRKKTPSAFFVSLIFLAYIYVFTFHFNFNKLPRYTFPIHLWVIPIVAFGIQVLSFLLSGIKEVRKRITAYALLLLMLVLTFNPANTYHAINMSQAGRDEISGEYLHKFDKAAKVYGSEIKDSPVMCWNCHPLFWFGLADLSLNQVKYFRSQSEGGAKDALNYMDKNKSGWLILDAQRYKKNFEVAYLKKPWKNGLDTNPPAKNLKFEGRTFKYVDHINGFYLYKW